MRKLFLIFLSVMAAAQTTNNNILPATSGLNLGSPIQRWNGYLQNINISGTCALNGLPCLGSGNGIPITTVAGLSTLAGSKVGTPAIVTNGSTATDCAVGGGSNSVLCIFNGSGWSAYTTGSAVFPTASIIAQGLASTGPGQTYLPFVMPVVPADLYLGTAVDICDAAGQAAKAYPSATIQMTISGATNPCSVNPFTDRTEVPFQITATTASITVGGVATINTLNTCPIAKNCLANGDALYFSNMSYLTALNTNYLVVSNVTSTSFQVTLTGYGGGALSSAADSGTPFWSGISANSQSFQGDITVRCRGTVPCKLQIDSAWNFYWNPGNPGGGGTVVDFGGIEVDASASTGGAPSFHTTSGQRVYTAGSADQTGDLGTIWWGGQTFKIDNHTSNASITSGCAVITNTGGWAGNPAFGPYGGGWVNLDNTDDFRDSGAFEIISSDSHDSRCGGSAGPTSTTFTIVAPQMAACNTTGAATSCGAGMVVAFESHMFDLGPPAYAYGVPTNSGLTARPCKVPNGNTGGTGVTCNRFGNKILNLGNVYGVGWGIGGIRNSGCMESCNIENHGAGQTIFYTSMYDGDFSGGEQNWNGMRDFLDYCGGPNPQDTSLCATVYGHWHVGIIYVGGSNWLHGDIANITFNNHAYADVVMDNFQSFSGLVDFNKIHVQNTASDSKNNNSVAGNSTFGLGIFLLGSQGSSSGTGASGALFYDLQSDAVPSVLCNICIMGSTQVPVTGGAMFNWQSTTQFTYPACILDSNSKIECLKWQQPGTPAGQLANTSCVTGGSAPSWTVSSTLGSNFTSSDGSGGDSCTWVNIGTTYPNSTGYGDNVVVLNSTNEVSNTTTLWNGQTNKAWACNQMPDYRFSFNGSSSSANEASTCSTYAPQFGTGFNMSGGTFTCTGSGCPSALPSLSSLSPAVGANTMLNANNGGQAWDWALTTNSSTAFTLGESSASTGTATNIFNVNTVAGSTAIPVQIQNSLTGSQSFPALEVTPTWNTSAVVDAGILEIVTNTASAGASLLLDLQVGATSEFAVNRSGKVTAQGAVNAVNGYQYNGAAALNHCLLGNATDFVDSTNCGGGVLNAGPALLGTFAINSVIASTVANQAGHFTNIQVVTTLGGTCSTPPQFNVFDGTSNVGSTVTASASTQTKGTGTSTAQTQTFASGDLIGIYISTAGGTCTTDQFIVSAQYATP